MAVCYVCMFTVYDVTSKQSFAKLDQWINELETHSTKHDIVTMLVGNKIDKVICQNVFVRIYLIIGTGIGQLIDSEQSFFPKELVLWILR